MVDLLEAPGLGLDIDAEAAKKYLKRRRCRFLRLNPSSTPTTRTVCPDWHRNDTFRAMHMTSGRLDVRFRSFAP